MKIDAGKIRRINEAVQFFHVFFHMPVAPFAFSKQFCLLADARRCFHDIIRLIEVHRYVFPERIADFLCLAADSPYFGKQCFFFLLHFFNCIINAFLFL